MLGIQGFTVLVKVNVTALITDAVISDTLRKAFCGIAEYVP
jgi:hypothetical protein